MLSGAVVAGYAFSWRLSMLYVSFFIFVDTILKDFFSRVQSEERPTLCFRSLMASNF